MLTHKTRSKRNYHQMLKETADLPGGVNENDLAQAFPNHHKKKFKYSSRVGGNDEDVDMISIVIHGNENQLDVQKPTLQVDRIKSEIEKYKAEVLKMNSSIKYCPCDYSNYC